MKKILYIGNRLVKKHKTPSSIDVLGPLLEKEGHTIRYTSSKKNKSIRMLDMLLACHKQRKKVDCVLVDTYSTQNFYYAFLTTQLCRFLRLKYIPILHGGSLEKRLIKNKRLSKCIFSNAYINISPSLFLKKTFEKYGYYNIKYIPNAIQIESYPYKKRIQIQPRLLWVRSFADIYNPIMAVEVMKILKDDLKKPPSLCMIGPEKDKSFSHTKMLAEKLNVDILFTGKLKKEEWIERSKEYDIFINTTNVDNMPVSVIEAMALGLPVVSTNVGGLPYLLQTGENALLIEKGNAKQMAGEIKRLLNDSTLVQKISTQARENSESFNWEVIKKEWKEVLI